MFAAIPLLALPVIIYNVAALTLVGGFSATDATAAMDGKLFSISMTSGSAWPVGLGDLLIAVSLVVLFIELLKSTTSRRVAIINHSLSMVLFIACLVEFLLFPAFATSTFFLITLMVLLDVLAGFIVTIVASRRDIDFGGD
ncbi:hypothetical protein [Phenylobacterium sp.]|uniref:hypothetical protein n=1 Tax=Phenylobacterium sp. TaxID=1871053 RepID=UPI0035B2C0B9